MTDRELLEAAAKAVNNGAWHPLTHDTPNGMWNPLTDDGDALRLAVKLRMSVDFYGVENQQVEANVNGHPACGHGESPVGKDAAAATRRAIVRAAAAMAGDA